MESYLEVQVAWFKRPPYDTICLPSLGMYTETEIIQWWEQIICKQNRLLFLLRKANHSVCNLFNCLFPFQMLFINKLTLTAWSFPFTSISGTSWYQGDKFRATWTVRFAGSRTSWVGPMVSPSVITALIVQRKKDCFIRHECGSHFQSLCLHLAANYAFLFGDTFSEYACVIHCTTSSFTRLKIYHPQLYHRAKVSQIDCRKFVTVDLVPRG